MAILIDPQTKTVSEVETTGTCEDMYRLIGCDLIDVVYLPHGNMLIVDDEGLLKPNCLFLIQGFPQPLAGKALLIGQSDEDFKQAPKVSLSEARNMVSFSSMVTG